MILFKHVKKIYHEMVSDTFLIVSRLNVIYLVKSR